MICSVSSLYNEYFFLFNSWEFFMKKLLSVKEKPNKKQAKPKAVKDPNQPKRPPTAFFVYLYAISLTPIMQYYSWLLCSDSLMR